MQKRKPTPNQESLLWVELLKLWSQSIVSLMAEISWIRCLYKKLPTSAALATDA